MSSSHIAVEMGCVSKPGWLTKTELGTAGFSRKECSRTKSGGPKEAGSSTKCACWKMWSMGHTKGSSRRPPPGALHLSSGALHAAGAQLSMARIGPSWQL